jgi:Arc/MetJ family transcription regulator
MRITIRLDDELLQQARRLGKTSGRTLSSVIEDALREFLLQRKKRRKAKPSPLASGGVGGLQLGADLDRTAELLNLMEGWG